VGSIRADRLSSAYPKVACTHKVCVPNRCDEHSTCVRNQNVRVSTLYTYLIFLVLSTKRVRTPKRLLTQNVNVPRMCMR
jgi:hypothetical protein